MSDKQNKDFEVVVVGNVGIDTNIYLDVDEIDFDKETNFTENLDNVGQAGGYSSRGFAQLGRRTAFIGYIGDDQNGRLIREAFADDGIDMKGLFVDPAGTSRSVNFVSRDGRRQSFYDGKGHMHLKPNLTICRSVLAQAKVAHFSIPNWARALLPIARDLGLTIACDIQDVQSAGDPYRQDFVEYADILFFSAVDQDEPSALIATFLDRKPDQMILAGMGADGCALGTRDGIRFFKAVEMDAPVIDTNGAGDSLAVGFLSSYILEGHSLVGAVHHGQIAARHACSIKASSSNLITPEKL